MLGEIDKNFYCSTDSYISEYDQCVLFGETEITECTKENCRYCRHKHPTPEEFKKEFGFDVPEDMPVWYIDSDDPEDEWMLDIYYLAVERQRYKIVVACTPFIPSNSWRPEVTR